MFPSSLKQARETQAQRARRGVPIRIGAFLCLVALTSVIATAAPAPAVADLQRVTLQLNWKHQFQFAGYYAAIERGYYRDAGFDVRLQEAQEDRDPIDTVLTGEADFGVGASELALRRGLGQPVVVLATILQHSPLVLIAARHGEGSVHELAGKTVMMMPHETELIAYLQREGLPLDRIVQVPHSFDLNDLLKGKVAAASGYSTDEPYLLKKSRPCVRYFFATSQRYRFLRRFAFYDAKGRARATRPRGGVHQCQPARLAVCDGP